MAGVIGEIADWPGHNPEELKAMKDAVELSRQRGVEIIED
jgi:hypothetical protein